MSNTNNNKKEKIFVDGVWIREKKFDDGGSILKVGMLADKVISFLKKYKKDTGYVDIVISAKRNPDDNGSHYACLDTWEKPSQSNAAPKQKPVKAPVQELGDEDI